MNFMSIRQGFYEEGSKVRHPFSQSPSSSSSSPSPQQQRSLHGVGPPYTYNHGHQQQERPSWMDSNTQSRAVDLVMDSSSPTNNGGGTGDEADDSEDRQLNVLARRGAAAEDHAGGNGSGSTSTSSMMMIEREHMFDKVVTPSDVGKLNRLVIPKQHAEKYFPLDSSTNEKGLLLNFEDRNGKPWRFRYSYWNSSQSYVMTKGWSRFVKEKKLDAGDIVSFQRGVGELAKDRLFIDWRRRPDAPELAPPIPGFSLQHQQFSFSRTSQQLHPWNQPLFLQPSQARDHSHLLHHHHHHHQYSYPTSTGYAYGSGPNYGVVNGNPLSGPVIYFRSAGGGGGGGAVGGGGGVHVPQQVGMVQLQRGHGVGAGGVEPMVFESVPVVQGKAAAKRLRLFGVNMDCPIPESDECDILSSTTTTTLPIAPHDLMPLAHHSSSSPTSNSNTASLHLSPFNGTPIRTLPSDLHNKGKSSMSLDLDI